MKLFSSTSDAIAEVHRAIGDYADDFDCQAIAEEMTYWHTETLADGTIVLNKSGLVWDDSKNFWGIVQENELQQGAEQ